MEEPWHITGAHVCVQAMITMQQSQVHLIQRVVWVLGIGKTNLFNFFSSPCLYYFFFLLSNLLFSVTSLKILLFLPNGNGKEGGHYQETLVI